MTLKNQVIKLTLLLLISLSISCEKQEIEESDLTKSLIKSSSSDQNFLVVDPDKEYSFEASFKAPSPSSVFEQITVTHTGSFKIVEQINDRTLKGQGTLENGGTLAITLLLTEDKNDVYYLDASLYNSQDQTSSNLIRFLLFAEISIENGDTLQDNNVFGSFISNVI